MKAIGIVFTTMWKHEVLKQAQVILSKSEIFPRGIKRLHAGSQLLLHIGSTLEKGTRVTRGDPLGLSCHATYLTAGSVVAPIYRGRQTPRKP